MIYFILKGFLVLSQYTFLNTFLKSSLGNTNVFATEKTLVVRLDNLFIVVVTGVRPKCTQRPPASAIEPQDHE